MPRRMRPVIPCSALCVHPALHSNSTSCEMRRARSCCAKLCSLRQLTMTSPRKHALPAPPVCGLLLCGCGESRDTALIWPAPPAVASGWLACSHRDISICASSNSSARTCRYIQQSVYMIGPIGHRPPAPACGARISFLHAYMHACMSVCVHV